MPYINLRIGQPLQTEQRQQLAREITRLMHQLMGKRREVTTVHIEQGTPDSWSVDGELLQESSPSGAYVDIKITAGTNTEADKAAMLAQTHVLLEQVLGSVQQASYVVIDEIPASDWGYAGHSQQARRLAAA